jgi:hypothetical protein
MTIFWVGGEEIDFSGAPVITLNAIGALDRQSVTGGGAHSVSFAGQTSVWMACLIYNYYAAPGFPIVGLRNSTSNSYIGVGAGSAKTTLACFIGDDIATPTMFCEAEYAAAYMERIDIHIEDYGSQSGRVMLYNDGNLVGNFTGNLVVGDGGALDQVILLRPVTASYCSSIIISDEDTRLMQLKTLTPDEAGVTNEWTGTYLDIADITLNASKCIYTNDADLTFQCKVSGMPEGYYSVKGVGLSYRVAKSSPGLRIIHGIYVSGAETVSSAVDIDTYWESKLQLYQVNPVTSVAFTPEDIEEIRMVFRSSV